MRRTRARLLASAVVLVAASAAYAMVEVWPLAPTSNSSIKTTQQGRIVFSVRNKTGSTYTVNGWSALGGPPATDNGCMGMSTPTPLLGGTQAIIPAGGQAQFIVTTAGYPNESDQGCVFEAMTNPAMVPGLQVGVTFFVRDAPLRQFELQPSFIDFGSMMSPAFESQQMRITNTGPNANVFLEIANDIDNVFSFDACSGKTCNVFVPGFGSAAGNATVRCTPGASGGLKSGAVWAWDSALKGTFMGSASLQCMVNAGAADIDIMESTLEIFAAEGQPGTVSTMVYSPSMNATWSVASVSDSNFSLDVCGGAMSCNPNLSLATPQPLTVTCIAQATQTQTTLYVAEPGGASDMAIVYCTPMLTSMPELTLSTNNLDFMMQPVNTTEMLPLRLTNTGNVPLSNIVIAFPPTTHWSASNCTQASPCDLMNMNEFVDLDIRFHPTSHNDKSLMATVTSMQTMQQSLNLMGIGTGGVLAITDPPPATPPQTGYHLQLGTIPRGQMTSQPLKVQNQGNATLMAVVGNVNPPYTVAPPTLTSVGPGLEQTFTVTCGSTTPSPNNDQVFTVTSPDAYLGASQTVTAHCAIADTIVQVNPLSFDFGELRTNGGPMNKTITVTLTNPGPADAQINSMQLRESLPGLTLTPAMTQATLAATTSRTAVMELRNEADVDLAGQSLDIDIDGEMLELPVTGKVVTASSRVVPQRELDLGTACVGTQVSGNVMLINDGTATLAVQPPQMNESFIAMAPQTSTLAPSTSLTATVMPAMSVQGQISGTLTWADDVPNSHEIDVKLDYVSSGTALSPRALDFGFVEVGKESDLQRIKLQNCDLERASIKVESLRTKRGPLAAWLIEPQVGYEKLLDGGEEQAINVRFVPPGRGMYEAQLTVVTQTGKQVITLRGDATGKDFPNTSFYACACSGPGAPSRGWPVVIAVLFVIGRRRRVPSSAR